MPHFYQLGCGSNEGAVGGIPTLAPWNVFPIILIPFLIIGLAKAIKKRDGILIIPLIVGAIFWITYMFRQEVFVIEYFRVVVITAIFCMVCIGYGLEYIVSEVKISGRIVLPLKIFTIAVFVFLAFQYPGHNQWRKITLMIPGGVTTQLQAVPPINRYITDDDLRLFGSFEGKTFVAPPWKSLVIAAATRNFALATKPATISNNVLPYIDFVTANCAGRIELARQYKVEYVYSSKFTCDGFVEIGSSKEDLVLYKYE